MLPPEPDKPNWACITLASDTAYLEVVREIAEDHRLILCTP